MQVLRSQLTPHDAVGADPDSRKALDAQFAGKLTRHFDAPVLTFIVDDYEELYGKFMPDAENASHHSRMVVAHQKLVALREITGV